MPVEIQIKDHMLMPFGCPKWHIGQIQVHGVSTDGTYFTSTTKCVHIDRTRNEPSRLTNFAYFFPDAHSTFPEISDPEQAFDFAIDYIKGNCELQTKAEGRFLDIGAPNGKKTKLTKT